VWSFSCFSPAHVAFVVSRKFGHVFVHADLAPAVLGQDALWSRESLATGISICKALGVHSWQLWATLNFASAGKSNDNRKHL